MKGKIAVILSCAGCPYRMMGDVCVYSKQEKKEIVNKMDVSHHVLDGTLPINCPLPDGDDGFHSGETPLVQEKPIADTHLDEEAKVEITEWTPDKVLVDFATMFSERWVNIKFGLYQTEFKEYSVRLSDSNEHLCRISSTNGEIEFNANKMIDSPLGDKDFVFFMFIWHVAFREIKDYKITDELVLDFYLDQERPETPILMGMAQLFKDSPDVLNQERFEHICYMLGWEEDNQEENQESKEEEE